MVGMFLPEVLHEIVGTVFSRSVMLAVEYPENQHLDLEKTVYTRRHTI